MDRLDAMATLIAAADGGSLSAAARKLGKPLATVSRKVSELEAHLRAQLVVRTSRKLVLTEAGRAYVEAGRRLLDDLDEMERAASGEFRAPRGHLTITAPLMFGRLVVEPVVLEFLKTYADIDVRLVLTDQVVSLIDDHVDLAVRVGPLPDSSMVATRLGSVTWVTCASPAYLETRGEPRTPDGLLAHDCILFERWFHEAQWTFGRGAARRELALRSRFAVNSADAAISAAMAGAGIARVLSYQVHAAVAAGTLRLVLRPFEAEPLPVHIVYGGQTQMALKLRAFLDFAAPRLRAAIPVLPAVETTDATGADGRGSAA